MHGPWSAGGGGPASCVLPGPRPHLRGLPSLYDAVPVVPVGAPGTCFAGYVPKCLPALEPGEQPGGGLQRPRAAFSEPPPAGTRPKPFPPHTQVQKRGIFSTKLVVVCSQSGGGLAVSCVCLVECASPAAVGVTVLAQPSPCLSSCPVPQPVSLCLGPSVASVTPGPVPLPPPRRGRSHCRASPARLGDPMRQL